MFFLPEGKSFFSYVHPDDSSPKFSPCFLPQATERFVGQLIDSVGVHLHRDSAVAGRNLVRSFQKTSICIHLLIDLKVTDSPCFFYSYVSICFFQCVSMLISTHMTHLVDPKTMWLCRCLFRKRDRFIITVYIYIMTLVFTLYWYILYLSNTYIYIGILSIYLSNLI
jgi:hypothetical protein